MKNLEEYDQELVENWLLQGSFAGDKTIYTSSKNPSILFTCGDTIKLRYIFNHFSEGYGKDLDGDPILYRFYCPVNRTTVFVPLVWIGRHDDALVTSHILAIRHLFSKIGKQGFQRAVFSQNLFKFLVRLLMFTVHMKVGFLLGSENILGR